MDAEGCGEDITQGELVNESFTTRNPRPVKVIPEPALGLLMLASLGTLAALRRALKRRA